MKIVLLSTDYLFDGCQAGLFRVSGDGGAKDIEESFVQGNCYNNILDDLAIKWPGDYEFFLTGGVVKADEQVLSKNVMTLQSWRCEITNKDIDDGECFLKLPSPDLFVMKFFLREEPCVLARVTVFLDMRTIELTTDDDAAITVLGDPADYVLSVGPALDHFGWSWTATKVWPPLDLRTTS